MHRHVAVVRQAFRDYAANVAGVQEARRGSA